MNATFLHNGKQIPSTFRRKVEIEIFFIFPACFVSFTVSCEEGMRLFWRIKNNESLEHIPGLWAGREQAQGCLGIVIYMYYLYV